MTLTKAAAQNVNIWVRGGRASQECTAMSFWAVGLNPPLFYPLPCVFFVPPPNSTSLRLQLILACAVAVKIPNKQLSTFSQPCSAWSRKTGYLAYVCACASPVPLSLALAPHWLCTSVAENPPVLCCAPAVFSPVRLLSASLKRKTKQNALWGPLHQALWNQECVSKW